MELAMTKSNNRKNEHVSLAQKFYREKESPLKDVQLVHHSLPQTDLDQVDLAVSFAGLNFKAPFFINAMTGGSQWSQTINEKLAIIARESQLAMATGSVSAALKDPSLAPSYQVVRQVNPHNIILANLGANHGLENAKRAVDLLQADALQVHLNAPQEIVMPEGDRTFSQWLDNIQAICSGLDLPVIVKEVGFGMSKETVQTLEEAGVTYIDVSGSGGTNFAQIENYRRKENKLDDFEGIGQTTAISLLEAMEARQKSQIIASGGIRTPLDIVKSLALGADLVGISNQILHLAIKDVNKAIETIDQWKEELKKWYTILGAKKSADLQVKTDLVITGQTAAWCQARQIDLTPYAKRRAKSQTR